MLVLSRKPNQRIIIGNQLVRITVVDVRGDNVRLGFEAPDDISVHREEVFDAILAEGGEPAAFGREHSLRSEASLRARASEPRAGSRTGRGARKANMTSGRRGPPA